MLQRISRLFQAVAQEFQQPYHVSMPHEYGDAVQVAAALPLRQPPVDPPDLVGVFEADFHRLPLDRELLE